MWDSVKIQGFFQAAETKPAQGAEQTHQIIPSNRLWMMRWDWVTTISNVTWVQPNCKRGEHLVQPAQLRELLRTAPAPEHLTPSESSFIIYCLSTSQINRTSCLVLSYSGTMGPTLAWHRSAANKHLTVEGRSEQISWISD